MVVNRQDAFRLSPLRCFYLPRLAIHKISIALPSVGKKASDKVEKAMRERCKLLLALCVAISSAIAFPRKENAFDYGTFVAIELQSLPHQA